MISFHCTFVSILSFLCFFFLGQMKLYILNKLNQFDVFVCITEREWKIKRKRWIKNERNVSPMIKISFHHMNVDTHTHSNRWSERLQFAKRFSECSYLSYLFYQIISFFLYSHAISFVRIFRWAILKSTIIWAMSNCLFVYLLSTVFTSLMCENTHMMFILSYIQTNENTEKQ